MSTITLPSQGHHFNKTTRTSPVVSPMISSESILQGETAIRIQHNGEIYQLRTTRLGKLILTK